MALQQQGQSQSSNLVQFIVDLNEQVGVPQMVMNGDTGQLALAHADANRWERIGHQNYSIWMRRRIKYKKETFYHSLFYRKCERCRCPLCMDPSRWLQIHVHLCKLERSSNHLIFGTNRSAGEPTMHLCHYPNCGKIYKKTSHLRAHLRWHIGDQPYLCSWPGCVRRFTRWPDPKRLDIRLVTRSLYLTL